MDAESNPVVNLEDQDSPTVVAMSPENTIVLDDDGDSDRARQLAEDERVARELQDSFALEDQPPVFCLSSPKMNDSQNAVMMLWRRFHVKVELRIPEQNVLGSHPE